MRQVARVTLPAPGPTYFAEKTKLIVRKRKVTTKRKEARRLWKQAHGTLAMKAAVGALLQMNSKLPWCMYCEAETATTLKKGQRLAIVDHWEPIKEAPQRAFDWDNHFLACQRCNGFFKHSAFPRDAAGNSLLIHLVNDVVDDHLEYEPSNGKFVAKVGSNKGNTTLDFFQLRDFDGSRYSVWTAVIEHIREYDRAIATGDQNRADMVRMYVSESRHRSVVHRLVTIAGGPHGGALTAPDIPALVVTHGVASWL